MLGSMGSYHGLYLAAPDDGYPSDANTQLDDQMCVSILAGLHDNRIITILNKLPSIKVNRRQTLVVL